MKVRELMTPEPDTALPTDMLSLIEEKMRHGNFRRVPIVDEAGRLVGIVTDGNLREYVGYLAKTRATAAMVEFPITISLNATIGAAADVMRCHKIGGLPVVDKEGGLVGVITESDLLLALAEGILSDCGFGPAIDRESMR